jgi:hypothetical protein
MRWAILHYQSDYFVRQGDDLRIDFLLELINHPELAS